MSNFAKKSNTKKKKSKANKVLTPRQANAVKRIVDSKLEAEVEKKYRDYTLDAVAISSTPVVSDISVMALGTSAQQRIGDVVELKSIQFRFQCTLADTTNYIRLILFQWKQDAQTAPTWADIMEFESGGVPIAQYERMSPYSLYTSIEGSFRVIKDIRFILDTDNPVQLIEGFINKGFTKNIHYSQAASTYGVNHLYMMMLSDSGAVSHPSIDGFIRLRYTDM